MRRSLAESASKPSAGDSGTPAPSATSRSSARATSLTRASPARARDPPARGPASPVSPAAPSRCRARREPSRVPAGRVSHPARRPPPGATRGRRRCRARPRRPRGAPARSPAGGPTDERARLPPARDAALHRGRPAPSRERGSGPPGEQRRVATVERLVLATGLEHVLQAGTRLSRGDPRAAARVEIRPDEMAPVGDRVQLLRRGPSDLDITELERRVGDVRHCVRDPRLEAVLLTGPEPVRGIRERLVQPPRVQLDERAERGDERIARDRPARLRIHPGLVPDRLRLRETIGERQRIDGEDVGGVVLGVQRAGDERLLRMLECLFDGGEPPPRRRTRGWR